MVQEKAQNKYFWECPGCHSRFFSEPVTLGIKNGALVRIHPICTNCFEKCRAGHEFGYGERCQTCGDSRRRFNLIRHSIPADDPTFGLTSTGSAAYPTAEFGGPQGTAADVSGGYLVADKFTLSVPGTVTRIAVYSPVAGNAKLGLYGDSSGPNNLLITEVAVACSANQWNWANTADTYLVAAAYWLTGNSDTLGTIGRNVSGGVGQYKAWTYTTAFPATGGSGWTTTTWQIAYKAEYVKIKNYAYTYKFSLADQAIVTSLSFYVNAGASGHFRNAIYNDSGGSPNAKQWESGSIAASAAAWNTHNISDGTPTTLTLAVGTYHLAHQWDDVTAGPSYTAGTAGYGSRLQQTYGAFPATWAGGTAVADEWSLYATYTILESISVTDSGTGTEIVSVSETLTINDTALGTELVYLLGEVLIDGLQLNHALKIRVSEPTTVASKSVSVGLPTRIYLGRQGRTLEIEGYEVTVAALNVLSALADGAVHTIQLPTGDCVSVHIPLVTPIRPIDPNEYPYAIHAIERMD